MQQLVWLAILAAEFEIASHHLCLYVKLGTSDALSSVVQVSSVEWRPGWEECVLQLNGYKISIKFTVYTQHDLL